MWVKCNFPFFSPFQLISLSLRLKLLSLSPLSLISQIKSCPCCHRSRLESISFLFAQIGMPVLLPLNPLNPSLFSLLISEFGCVGCDWVFCVCSYGFGGYGGGMAFDFFFFCVGLMAVMVVMVVVCWLWWWFGFLIFFFLWVWWLWW